MRYYPMFPWTIPHPRVDHLRVTHPSATLKVPEGTPTVRLACLKRAASVRSEPGSNSPLYNLSLSEKRLIYLRFSSLTRITSTPFPFICQRSFALPPLHFEWLHMPKLANYTVTPHPLSSTKRTFFSQSRTAGTFKFLRCCQAPKRKRFTGRRACRLLLSLRFAVANPVYPAAVLGPLLW